MIYGESDNISTSEEKKLGYVIDKNFSITVSVNNIT